MSDLLAGVRLLAEQAANQRGRSLLDSDLRLFGPGATHRERGRSVDTTPDDPISPFELGRAYELGLVPASRRATGAHLTPESIARGLVAMMAEPTGPQRVLDPAVGGGAFLMVAADRSVAAGVPASSVLDQLHGIDIDPGAVAVAEAALALWALDHGLEPVPLENLVCGDGLLVDLPSVDVVVGNPPFLNQLRSSSANSPRRRDLLKERFGELMGAYTDDAWLFLAAGMDVVGDGGSLAMIQPLSVLAARHAAPVRSRLHAQAAMTGCWIAGEPVFDAAVQVCGLAFEHRGHGKAPVDRRFGPDFEVRPPARTAEPHQWGSTAAALMGIPEIDLNQTVEGSHATPTVADLATATAGFRDQFYGFVPYVHEAESPGADGAARLVTVGMLEPLALEWGSREFRFAKQRFRAPIVDLHALAEGDPRLHAWVGERRQPKVLLATQTRVVEVWVDENGSSIPATPVVSIEPHDRQVATCWQVATALSAPAVTAHHLGANFGTAMSLNALKLSARDVLATPLPTHEHPWNDAVSLASTSNDADRTRKFWREFGELMNRAYGIDDLTLLDWWLGRVSPR